MMNQKEWKYSGSQSEAESERERKHRKLARRAAAEGIVLLENDGVLPLHTGSKVALYGGGASYTIKGGTGSGAVNNRSNVSITQGLLDAGLILTDEEWLQDYDQRYQQTRREWIHTIYEISIPGDFDSLYRAHATHPLAMPQGQEIIKTDADIAIYVISRVSGEGADRKAVKGDYYLSDIEEAELQQISSLYAKTIVILNTGGVLDLSFLDRYPISALLSLSQAGMEGGHALADVLIGAVSPSGRLTDTWAYRYEDYPSSATFSHNNGNVIEEPYTEGIYVGYRYFDSFGIQPRFAFGHGLSYTTFSVQVLSGFLTKGELYGEISVTNTGKYAGKETVMLFASCPQGALIKEKKRLIGFEKTPLLFPGESYILRIESELRLLESYHSGQSAYFMEAGDYYILAGRSAEEEIPVLQLHLQETHCMEQLEEICPLLDALAEIEPTRERYETWQQQYQQLFAGVAASQEPTRVGTIRPKEFAANNAAGDTINLDSYLQERGNPYLQEKEIREADVSQLEEETIKSDSDRQSGECQENFVTAAAKAICSQLTLEEKAALCCGQPTEGDAGFIGNASASVPGAAGETTSILAERYQVANLIMADGPAGIRIQKCYRVNPQNGKIYQMDRYQALENRIFGKEFEWEGADHYYQFCSAIPVGTLLAQTFDRKLLEEIGDMIGREMEEYHISLWLAPGMNIHRNPLCGRNFEYYSEDPLVSGCMAAAITKGVQKHRGLGTTIKHYACNNQEENRRGVSSIVSERALREIYLKGFEIAIREAQPRAIMTSYNKINGVHAANNYDLCTKAARREWNFAGIIMTDWTTTHAGGGSSAAKCLQAGNDLVMPGKPSDIREIIDAVNRTGKQHISPECLDACCIRILESVLTSDRYEEKEG